MTKKRTKRLDRETRDFIVAVMNRWPIMTDDLQNACKEAGLRRPTYKQIRYIERQINTCPVCQSSRCCRFKETGVACGW